METAIVVAILAAVSAIAVAGIGAMISRRFGLPTNIEQQLINELKELNAALTANNERLEGEVAEVTRKLNAERKQRASDSAECKRRLTETENRLDDAEAQVQRLLLRIQGGRKKHD